MIACGFCLAMCVCCVYVCVCVCALCVYVCVLCQHLLYFGSVLMNEACIKCLIHVSTDDDGPLSSKEKQGCSDVERKDTFHPKKLDRKNHFFFNSYFKEIFT